MRDGDGASLLADTLGAGRDDRALGALVLELHGKLQSAAVHRHWLARVAGAALAAICRRAWRIRALRDAAASDAVRRKALHWGALLRGAAEEMADG